MVIDIFLLGQGRNDNPSENYVLNPWSNRYFGNTQTGVTEELLMR